MFLVVAGVFAFVGFEALVAAAILALANVVSAWLAAMIVAVALFGAGRNFGDCWRLKRIKKEGAVPTQTVKSLQEDAQWAKEQISELTKIIMFSSNSKWPTNLPKKFALILNKRAKK